MKYHDSRPVGQSVLPLDTFCGRCRTKIAVTSITQASERRHVRSGSVQANSTAKRNQRLTDRGEHDRWLQNRSAQEGVYTMARFTHARPLRPGNNRELHYVSPPGGQALLQSHASGGATSLDNHLGCFLPERGNALHGRASGPRRLHFVQRTRETLHVVNRWKNTDCKVC